MKIFHTNIQFFHISSQIFCHPLRQGSYHRRIAPAFDKVVEQYADTLIAGKINYDEEPQLIERFGIDTIPTLMLFKNGEVIGSVVAPGSKAAIEAFIKETLEQ